MPEEKTSGPAEEVAQGLRSIFDRIGEFFHLFDLSFVVSGASTFGAAVFLYLRSGYARTLPFPKWSTVAAAIIASYICGLLAFAAGRWLNGRFFRPTLLEERLPKAIALHGLTSEVLSSYLPDPTSRAHVWRLYIRMWADIARHEPRSVTFHHLSRYWVMAATYDGVAFSLLIWAAVLLAATCPFIAPQRLGIPAGLSGAVFAVVFAIVAFKRAADYYEYQIEDVVAAIAARHRLV